MLHPYFWLGTGAISGHDRTTPVGIVPAQRAETSPADICGQVQIRPTTSSVRSARVDRSRLVGLDRSPCWLEGLLAWLHLAVGFGVGLGRGGIEVADEAADDFVSFPRVAGFFVGPL